jgi:hypothetical protein
MTGDVIPMFELVLDGQDLKLVEEKHYKLVPSDQIGAEGLFNKTCAALWVLVEKLSDTPPRPITWS